MVGPKKLLELVKSDNLVSDLDKRELENPEGAGFDLRLGEIHEITGGTAFLGVTERETPDVATVARHDPEKPSQFIFQPNKYFLVSTIESVNLPVDIAANIKPRTTTFRSGLILRTGAVQPGYQGKLSFGCINLGPIPVTVELGARIVFIQFHRVEGGGEQYRGQWQGGRVTTEKREKQV